MLQSYNWSWNELTFDKRDVREDCYVTLQASTKNSFWMLAFLNWMQHFFVCFFLNNGHKMYNKLFFVRSICPCLLIYYAHAKDFKHQSFCFEAREKNKIFGMLLTSMGTIDQSLVGKWMVQTWEKALTSSTNYPWTWQTKSLQRAELNATYVVKSWKGKISSGMFESIFNFPSFRRESRVKYSY